MRLLVTRPDPDAQRTSATLRERGHHVTISPLLRIEGLAADLGAGPWDAVVMTSANSCRSTANHPRRGELIGLPVFAVGRHTAEAARMAGFADVTSADGDARDLARLLAARFAASDRRLLYVAGEDRTADIASDFASEGISMKTVVIYRAVKITEFTPQASRALSENEIDGVLHFSRRTVESYLSCAVGAALLENALAPFHYCLSARVVRPLLQAGATAVRVSPRPDETALIDIIGVAG